MRIHSSFDDQHRRRRAAADQPYRRLLRLVLAMVLVIAVMRQAANPRIYEVFFTAPPPAVDAALAGTAAPDSPPPATAGDEAAAADLQVGQVIDQTVAEQDEATNRRLMQWLAAAHATAQRTSEDTAAETPVAGPWLDRADLPADVADILEAVSRAADLTQSEPFPWARLQESLDRWALQRVDSAAVWKAADALAFYRLLDEPIPAWLARQPGVQASVTALLQQPEIYLHQRIVIPATVARAIQRQAAENPFGVSDYWELWLRPRDGSDHPLVLFTRQVTPEIAQVPADAALLDGPAVWADGVYLKPLAHRSASGGELSPALVGKLHALVAETAATPAQPATPAPSGWLLVALAALIGITAVLLIAIQNRRQANRLRALRRAATEPKPTFLQLVDEHPSDDFPVDETGAAS